MKATDERLTTKDPLLFATTTAHKLVCGRRRCPRPVRRIQRFFDLRALTLRPDTAVVFPGKRGLKRTPVITLAVRWTQHCRHCYACGDCDSLMQTGRHEAALAQQPNGTEWNVSYPPAPFSPSITEEATAWTTSAHTSTPVPFASNTSEVETGNTNASPSRGSSMTRARRLFRCPLTAVQKLMPAWRQKQRYGGCRSPQPPA